jgi:hypothetical protein
VAPARDTPGGVWGKHAGGGGERADVTDSEQVDEDGEQIHEEGESAGEEGERKAGHGVQPGEGGGGEGGADGALPSRVGRGG